MADNFRKVGNQGNNAARGVVGQTTNVVGVVGNKAGIGMQDGAPQIKALNRFNYDDSEGKKFCCCCELDVGLLVIGIIMALGSVVTTSQVPNGHALLVNFLAGVCLVGAILANHRTLLDASRILFIVGIVIATIWFFYTIAALIWIVVVQDVDYDEYTLSIASASNVNKDDYSQGKARFAGAMLVFTALINLILTSYVFSGVVALRNRWAKIDERREAIEIAQAAAYADQVPVNV